jgi:ankyrin repeat protein
MDAVKWHVTSRPAAVLFVLVVVGCLVLSSVSCAGSVEEGSPGPETGLEQKNEQPNEMVPAEGVASEEHLIEAVAAQDVMAVEQLLGAGVSPNVVDASGDPLLKAAILNQNRELVELFVKSGCDVNALDSRGFAMLPQAVRTGQLEIVHLLLDAGADVNGTMDATSGDWSYRKAPAITHAVLTGRSDLVELLIAYGADVNLAEKYDKDTPIHTAAHLNDAESIQLLLDAGADPNLHSGYYLWETPLHYAAEAGAMEAMQALLDGGVDVDCRVDQGISPMMSVIKAGQADLVTQVVTFLLANGADPNLQDAKGNTALHLAAKNGRPEVIPLLIGHGAAIDSQNKSGDTALHVAAQSEQAEIVSILVEHGASLDMKNDKGETAVDVAAGDEIIEILNQAGQ